MLSYEEFEERLSEEIRRILGQNTVLEFKTVKKINGISYEGLLIKNCEKGVFPVFPMEPCYLAYKRGQVCLDEIIRTVRQRILAQPYELSDFVEDLQSLNKIKNRIFMRVVNYEKNVKWLEDYPYRKCMDLAIMCYIGADENGSDGYLANINYSLLEMMQLTEEELFHIAYENSVNRQPAVIKNMRELIPEILWKAIFDFTCDDNVESEIDDKMYVLTNPKKRLGAVCMFYEGALAELADELEDDLFILPSSVHETIVLPSKGLEAGNLKEIVREVNRTSVSQDEILGDSVYIYIRNKKKIEVCDAS